MRQFDDDPIDLNGKTILVTVEPVRSASSSSGRFWTVSAAPLHRVLA